MTRPIVIGVTGNIACGKTLVTDMLSALGAEIIDGDRVYADLATPGGPLLRDIANAFGPESLLPDGSLDRKTLGRRVFADPVELQRLDAVIRPYVVPEMLRRAEASTADVVVLDAVKLFESRLADACDERWVVVCDPRQQLERLMSRNGLDEAAALSRINSQRPQAEKIALADVVIDNSGSIDPTREQVRAAHDALIQRIHSTSA
ncbi:MAG: dephospho-CoA kinase [Chloroflexota bacterium]